MTPLRERVPYLMRLVIQAHSTLWQQRLPDLTKSQFAALTAIGERPGCEQAALVELTATDPATLAGVLLRLERRGLVARAVEPADRRRRSVRLTAEGQALLLRAAPTADAVTDEFLEPLTASERSQLRTLLLRLLPVDQPGP